MFFLPQMGEKIENMLSKFFIYLYIHCIGYNVARANHPVLPTGAIYPSLSRLHDWSSFSIPIDDSAKDANIGGNWFLGKTMQIFCLRC